VSFEIVTVRLSSEERSRISPNRLTTLVIGVCHDSQAPGYCILWAPPSLSPAPPRSTRGEHSAGPSCSRIPMCNAVAPKRDGRSRCRAANLQRSSGAYHPPMSPRARIGLKGRNPQAYPRLGVLLCHSRASIVGATAQTSVRPPRSYPSAAPEITRVVQRPSRTPHSEKIARDAFLELFGKTIVHL
jgi:hypothetical protein